MTSHTTFRLTHRGYRRHAALGLFSAAALIAPCLVHAQPAPLGDTLTGDVGLGVFSTQSIVRSKDNDTKLLPYVYADKGRFFARVDTFGVKTVPLGAGYLEFAGRVSQDGWKADTAQLKGLNDRKTPIPLGIGTFQETPYGGIFLNAFVDANKSHGALLEAVYAAKFQLGAVSIYPQAGVEYTSRKYNDYLYGVTAAESAASGFKAYQAGAATSPMLGVAVDVPVAQSWKLSLQWRHKWLGSDVKNSPVVQRSSQDSAFVALAYSFR